MAAIHKRHIRRYTDEVLCSTKCNAQENPLNDKSFSIENKGTLSGFHDSTGMIAPADRKNDCESPEKCKMRRPLESTWSQLDSNDVSRPDPLPGSMLETSSSIEEALPAMVVAPETENPYDSDSPANHSEIENGADSLPLCCSFSVISSQVNAQPTTRSADDQPILQHTHEDLTEEEIKTYQVITEVNWTGDIVFMEINVKMLSEYQSCDDGTESKEDGYMSDSNSADDVTDPPDCLDWDSDMVLEEQPVSCRLRTRKKRRVGGLFPSEMITWLDEVDSETSDDDANESTDVHSLPTVVVEIDSLPKKNTIVPSHQASKDGAKDEPETEKPKIEFSKVGSSGLKLVLKRNKVVNSDTNVVQRNFLKQRKSETKNDLTDLESDTDITHYHRIDKSGYLDCSGVTLENEVTLHNIKSRHLSTECNQITQPPGSASKPILPFKSTDDDESNKAEDTDEMLNQVDSGNSPDDVRNENDLTVEDVGSDVNSGVKRKHKKRNRKAIAGQQSGVALDEKRTELRLAMEFPRHNWLVKHIMKEERLKTDHEPTTRTSPIIPDNKSEEGKSSSPSPRSTPSPQNIRESGESAAVQDSQLAPVTTVALETPKEILPKSPKPLKTGLMTSSAITPNTSHSTTESTHVIGIVKPFHYPNEKDNPVPVTSLPDDVNFSKRHAIDDKIPLKTKTNDCDVIDCSTKEIFDVKIEKCFSLAPPLNQSSPLDLTKRSKADGEQSALDLTKRTLVPFVIPHKESNTTVYSTIEQDKITASVRVTSPGKDTKVSHTQEKFIHKKQTTPGTQLVRSRKELYNIVRRREEDDIKKITVDEKCPSIKKIAALQPAVSTAQITSRSMTSFVMTQLRNDAVKLSKVEDMRRKYNKESDVIDVDALDDELPSVLPRNSPKIGPTSSKALIAPHTVSKLGYRRRSSPGFGSTSTAFPRVSTINLDSMRVPQPPATRVGQSNSSPPDTVHTSVTPINRSNVPNIPRPNIKLLDTMRLYPSSNIQIQNHTPIRQHKLLQRPDHFQKPSVGHIVLAPQPTNPLMSPAPIPVKQDKQQQPTNQLPFIRSPYSSNRPPNQPRYMHHHTEMLTDLRDNNRDGYRVPIKPTPIHSGRHYPSNVTLTPSSSMYPHTQAVTSHSQARPGMTGARPMFPRAANTRGPPNRMVINNSTVHHPRHSLNRPLTDLEKMSSFRSPSVFEPWDAQSFSAQLKAQQNELHNKIESLKALEQKIQSVPTLPSHIRQDGPPMIPQVYRASPIVQTDYRKRKIKPIVPGSGQINDKFRKISPHVGATGKSPASEETCVVCKEKAYFVCSGCHGIWYCSKYCQFQDWTSHSKSCISQHSQV